MCSVSIQVESPEEKRQPIVVYTIQYMFWWRIKVNGTIKVMPNNMKDKYNRLVDSSTMV